MFNMRMNHLHVVSIAGAVVVVGLGLLAGCEKKHEAPTPSEVAAEVADSHPAQAPEDAARARTPENSTINVNGAFQTPESILHDTEADQYLVSNINGAPLDMDDNGFISRIDPQGKLLELKWIDGEKQGVTLNAPKGMAIAGGLLYVADIDAVRSFEMKTGEPRAEIRIEGATFLNDVVAAPDGAIYVSDSGMKAGKTGLVPSRSNAIHRIRGDRAEVFVKDASMPRPNGLLMDGQQLWAVGFATNEMFTITDGKKADVKTLPKGSLDGVIKTADGRLLVSSWEAKAIFASDAGGEFVEFISNVNAPADIGYDARRNRVLIPLFMDNSLRFEPLAAAAAPQAPSAPEKPADDEAAAKSDST